MHIDKKINALAITLSVGMAFFVMACSTDTEEINTKDNFEAVSLPDGSLVFLNHNTTLHYDRDFDERIVEVDGEAFFDIVANDAKFLIHTEFGDIEVLGTEFNVKTSAAQLEVDVKSGLVGLRTKYNNSEVKKGIKAIYKDGEKAIQEIKSDQEYKKWTRALKKEFKKLGKEVKPVAKKVGKEFKKAGTEIGKELKKLKD